MDSPLISVILPCCNATRSVAESVACVLARGCPEVDRLVIDDGSDDSSARGSRPG